jgi:hypothetical protein
MTASDRQFLAVELAILSLALLSRWCFSRLLFWTAWLLNLALVGIFGYVVFLWRPFA